MDFPALKLNILLTCFVSVSLISYTSDLCLKLNTSKPIKSIFNFPVELTGSLTFPSQPLFS
jgi:hypothetical protein